MYHNIKNSHPMITKNLYLFVFLLWTGALLNQRCVARPYSIVNSHRFKTDFASLPESVIITFLNHDRLE